MIFRILFLFVFVSSTVFPQSAQEIILKVQKKFNSVIDLKSNIIRVDNNSENLIGKFYYAKQDKYRIVFNYVTIVSNGKTVWQFNKKLNRVVITNANEEENSFSLKKIIFDYPKKCKAKIVTENKSKNNYIIKFTPLNSSLSFKWVKLTVTKNYLINQFEMLDLNNNKTTIKFDNIKINSNINLNKFKFKIPTGAKVVDLR